MINYLASFVNTDGNSFPNTASVNSSGPGTTDGTEFIKAMIDDLWGYNQALLNYTEDTPNGSSEANGASQRLNSINKIIANRDVVTATGTYTIKAFMKKGILLLNPTVTSITLAAGTGLDESNRLLIYNKAGVDVTVNLINSTIIMAPDDIVELIYSTATSDFNMITQSEIGYIETNIETSGTNIIAKKPKIEVGRRLINYSSDVTQNITALTADTWYAWTLREDNAAIAVFPLTTFDAAGTGNWDLTGLTSNQLAMFSSIWDDNKKYCRAFDGANYYRVFGVFKTNATPNGVAVVLGNELNFYIPNIPYDNFYTSRDTNQGTTGLTLINFANVKYDINSSYDASNQRYIPAFSQNVILNAYFHDATANLSANVTRAVIIKENGVIDVMANRAAFVAASDNIRIGTSLNRRGGVGNYFDVYINIDDKTLSGSNQNHFSGFGGEI